MGLWRTFDRGSFERTGWPDTGSHGQHADWRAAVILSPNCSLIPAKPQTLRRSPIKSAPTGRYRVSPTTGWVSADARVVRTILRDNRFRTVNETSRVATADHRPLGKSCGQIY
jgi:hypothetical protein